MTIRTTLSRSSPIAMLMAGAILLSLTGAASAKGGGGGFDRTLQRGTQQTQPNSGGTKAPAYGKPPRVLN